MENKIDPVFQDCIDECMDRFYQGEPLMLFEAIRQCGQYQVPLPVWALDELEKALYRYDSGEAKVLSAAFGVSRDGAKLTALQHKHERDGLGIELLSRVCFAVDRESARGAPVDAALFERVGSEFSMSASTVKKWYYEARKHIERFDKS